MPRQSEKAANVQRPGSGSGDVERTRKLFAERLNARLQELGVPEERRAGWLREKMGVRWQTAQFWLEGQSFPMGHNLTLLAEAIGMDPRELLGPMTDDVEPRWPTWAAFKATPEGQSMSDEERWALRLFAWPKPPTIGDYRSLLALVRANAERGTG
jgi:hypothetical protein